jgi:hypothetical protein
MKMQCMKTPCNLLNSIKTLLLVGCILVVQKSTSQENFQRGYLIDNKQDTIQGWIDYRNWSLNPHQIKFKRAESDKSFIYTPLEIKEFGVHNDVYSSGIVPYEISSTLTSKLEVTDALNLRVDTVFLLALIKGKKNLYFFRNEFDRDNFYIQRDSIFDLLIYKRYVKESQNRSYISENRKYLGQIYAYLMDCPAIASEFGNTLYDKKSLTKLFEFYYQSQDSKASYKKKYDTTTFEWGLLVGVTSCYLDLDGMYSDELAKTVYKTSINATAGMFLDLVLPRNRKKWSIHNELIYSSYLAKGSYNDYQNSDVYTLTSSEIGYSYLKLNNMVRYKYPLKSFSIFVDVGISNGIVLRETNYKKVQLKYWAIDRVSEDVAIEDTRKVEQGLLFGFGSCMGDYKLELRYEIGNGMSEYFSLISSTNRFSLLFGYTF